MAIKAGWGDGKLEWFYYSCCYALTRVFLKTVEKTNPILFADAIREPQEARVQKTTCRELLLSGRCHVTTVHSNDTPKYNRTSLSHYSSRQLSTRIHKIDRLVSTQ